MRRIKDAVHSITPAGLMTRINRYVPEIIDRAKEYACG
jgi:hypothetical protein